MSRTGPSALALPGTAVVALLWLVVACASNGVGAPSQPPTSSPQPTATTAPSVASSAAPTTTATAAASGTPVATVSADPNAPPAGWLSAGGEPVQGLSGTYCWHANGVGTCADFPAFTDRQPDLPPLTVDSSGSQLSFSLADSYPFASWGATYVDDNGDIVPLGGEQSSFDPDANQPSITPQTMVEFPLPPAEGDWIVQVFVRFTDGGDATYGWNVTVP